MSAEQVGLPEALERAASALPALADAIRPANGDPGQLARGLDSKEADTVLTWLLHHEPAAGAELVEAWAEVPEVAPLVAGIAPESLPKAARKALGRARHRMRSRGVALPAAGREEVVATLPQIDESVDEARVTGLDPHGVRLVYLAADHPTGGVRLFELALDEERGVVEFDAFGAGRSRVRRFLRDVERRERWPGVPAPPATARALIARAAARQAPERPAPRGFSEWRARLCDVPDATPTPGELAREALGAPEPDRSTLEAVAERVREAALGPWPPPIERVRPLLDRLDEIARGVIVVSDAARGDQVDRTLAEALDEIYDAPLRERTAERFEESAYVDWKSGREDAARASLAAARAFREQEPSAHPLARAMLETVLAPALQRARDGVDPAESEGADENAAETPPSVSRLET